LVGGREHLSSYLLSMAGFSRLLTPFMQKVGKRGGHTSPRAEACRSQTTKPPRPSGGLPPAFRDHVHPAELRGVCANSPRMPNRFPTINCPPSSGHITPAHLIPHPAQRYSGRHFWPWE